MSLDGSPDDNEAAMALQHKLDDGRPGSSSGSAITKRSRQGHSKPVIILTVSMVVIYIVSLIFPNSQRWGWLPTSVGNASDDHPTSMTPASYAFTIWIVIFLWQMLWLIYALVNLCRRNVDYGGPIYRNPAVVTAPFAVSYTVALLAVIAWYFAWTHGVMWVSLIIIAIVPASVWSCIALLAKALVKHENDFARRVDLWICRLLVLNGLSIFATWTSLATHINVAIVIVYDIGTPIATGSIVGLALLIILVSVFAFMDLFYWDRYLRYNLVSFPVVIWASTAVLVGRKLEEVDDDDDAFDVDASFVLAAVLLTIGCVAFLLKIVLLIVRSARENA